MMDNVGQHRQDNLPLEAEALLGLLLAMQGHTTLPARPWPVVAACQTLANELGPDSAFHESATAAAHHFTGEKSVEAWLRALAMRGCARGDGRGAQAHWTVGARWLADWGTATGSLPAEERVAWTRAAQTLTSCLSIWRKSLSAAE